MMGSETATNTNSTFPTAAASREKCEDKMTFNYEGEQEGAAKVNR